MWWSDSFWSHKCHSNVPHCIFLHSLSLYIQSERVRYSSQLYKPEYFHWSYIMASLQPFSSLLFIFNILLFLYLFCLCTFTLCDAKFLLPVTFCLNRSNPWATLANCVPEWGWYLTMVTVQSPRYILARTHSPLSFKSCQGHRWRKEGWKENRYQINPLDPASRVRHIKWRDRKSYKLPQHVFWKPLVCVL